MTKSSDYETLPLVGMFFHVHGSHGKISRQGVIRGAVGANAYLVQYFEWLMGFPNTLEIVPVASPIHRPSRLAIHNRRLPPQRGDNVGIRLVHSDRRIRSAGKDLHAPVKTVRVLAHDIDVRRVDRIPPASTGELRDLCHARALPIRATINATSATKSTATVPGSGIGCWLGP